MNSKVVLANSEPIPVILLANKCDLPDANVDKEKLDKFVKDNVSISSSLHHLVTMFLFPFLRLTLCHLQNLVGWFATSARENVNIGSFAATIAKHLSLLTRAIM